MPFNRAYDVYIFDCDGVILDSNQLKINAMERVLRTLSIDEEQIEECIAYFKRNFGKSRYHHVEYFVSEIIRFGHSTNLAALELQIIEKFSVLCQELYLEAELTTGFLEFLQSLDGKKYIASGSAQDELRTIFEARGLGVYFDGIYGSPISKSDNIGHILKSEKTHKAIMFGDALSDLEASISNEIDFLAYRPCSNVPELLTTQSKANGFEVIDSWSELI